MNHDLNAHVRIANRARLRTGAAASAVMVLSLLWAGPACADSEQTVRPEVGKPLVAAQALIRAGQGAEALVQLRELDAKPGLTPYEQHVLGRMRAAAAASAGLHAQAMAAYRELLASPLSQPAERLTLWQALAASAEQAKDPVELARACRGYLAEGGSDERVRVALVQALFQQGDHRGVSTELASLVARDEAAGKVPPEDRLKLLAKAQLSLQDDAGYVRVLELLLRHHPRPAYWADRIARASSAADFPPRLQLDALRLARQVQALEDKSEYLDLSQAATQAGLPGEALAVFDEGLARGLLGKGADAEPHKKQRQRLAKAAADDEGQWAAAEAPARKAKDGQALLALGQALCMQGQRERGLSLMQEGLLKGGLKQPDEARLRLGEMQWLAGQADAARATLQPLVGEAVGVPTLARLWVLAMR